MSGKLAPHAALGLAVRMRRLEAGLTQEALSLDSGVQRNFISLIETGQNQPTITTLFRLAEALDVRASRLVADAEKLMADRDAGRKV